MHACMACNESVACDNALSNKAVSMHHFRQSIKYQTKINEAISSNNMDAWQNDATSSMIPVSYKLIHWRYLAIGKDTDWQSTHTWTTRLPWYYQQRMMNYRGTILQLKRRFTCVFNDKSIYGSRNLDIVASRGSRYNLSPLHRPVTICWIYSIYAVSYRPWCAAYFGT